MKFVLRACKYCALIAASSTDFATCIFGPHEVGLKRSTMQIAIDYSTASTVYVLDTQLTAAPTDVPDLLHIPQCGK